MDKDKAIVRRARAGDLDKIMPVYEYARMKMAEGGNPNQWIDGYPSADVISDDIARGNSYIIEKDGAMAGVFTFIIGEDPTYNIIEGQWLNDNEYGTIHRIASAPGTRGVADICLEYCLMRVSDIRIDTHTDNAPMLGWTRSRGFEYCGIIYCHNGSPRLAFQKLG